MLNPFALDHHGDIIHIGEVDGKPGPYTCLGCSSPLLDIAESGADKRRQRRHFRHSVDTDCTGGPETALHRWSKDIVANALYVKLPVHVVRHERLQSSHNDEWQYLSAEVEPWRNSLRPDVVLHRMDGELAVEIRVHHEVDDAKMDEMRRRGASCIEIDMRPYLRDLFNLTALRAAVLHDAIRGWVSHELEADRKAVLTAQWETGRGERVTAFREALSRPHATPPDASLLDADISLYRLDRFVAIEVAGAHWFEDSPRHWQARQLLGMLRNLHANYDPDRPDLMPLTPKWHGERLHGTVLRDLPSADHEIIEDAGLSPKKYGSPGEAVVTWLRKVANIGPSDPHPTRPLHLLDPRQAEGAILDPTWARRFMALNRLTSHYADIAFSLRHDREVKKVEMQFRQWLRMPVASGGRSPLEICNNGGPTMHLLLAHVQAIANMVLGCGPPTRHRMGLAPEEAFHEAEARWKMEGPREGGRYDQGHKHQARALRILERGGTPLQALVQLARVRTTARIAGDFVTTPHPRLGGAAPHKFVRDQVTMLYVVPLLDQLGEHNARRFRYQR